MGIRNLARLHSSPTPFLSLEPPYGIPNCPNTITKQGLEQDNLLGEIQLRYFLPALWLQL